MADERPGGPPATPAIGAVPLPPGYVLVEKLGSGGFATVWLAEQGRLGRRVAVKLLGESLSDSERERRFIAECRAIGRLSGHPAVVTVHDAGTTDDGHPYLVMEHLPGGSLHDRLHRQGALPWPEVLDIGIHVADALAAAHDAGILHRDVKPANVLLDENGSPKLGDFGIARLSEGANTATGTLVGTITFTPPEVLSGHRPGPTADVWALGATLHTLLAGSSPFSGHRDEPPAATIARVLRSEPPALGPEVPAALRDLITGMLHAEPRDRPETCAEVVARLQAIQSERGLPVTPARATRSTTPTQPIGGTDATVVGQPALTGTPPPPPPPTGSPTPPPPPPPWGAPTPPPPPPPVGDRPALAKAGPAGEPDPDAATVSREVPPAPAGRADPPTVVGAPGAPELDPPTVIGPAGTAPPGPGAAPGAPPGVEGATSVLPVYDPSGPPPGGPGGPAPSYGAPAPPGPLGPPPGRPGAPGPSDRKGKAPLLVGVAVLVVLVLIAAAAVLLLGGGDGDGDGDEADGGPDSTEEGGTGSTEPGETAAATIDTPLGAPLDVPAGLEQEPVIPATWNNDAACGGTGACAVVADDGDVVAVRAPGDGTATVESLAAETGDVQWELVIDGLSSPPGLARLGDLVIVSSTAGDTRTYRGIDDSGTQRWAVEVPQDDRPVFPNTQLSQDYGVLLLGGVDAYLVVDLATGDTQRGEGRVLATDRTFVYVADGDRVVARTLANGNEQWVADGIVSGAPSGVFPAWRYGVVASDVFVTVTESEVVAVNRESAEEAWSARVPISVEGKDLGRPIAVSNVGDVVVVAAERGDLGIDARSGTEVWREVRDRLVFDPQLDAEAIDVAQGSPVWVGTGDRLLVGWTGAHLLLLDVTSGAVVSALDLDATGGRGAVAIGRDAIAIAEEGGVIAVYGYDGLGDALWTTDAYPESTGLAAVDGGLVVLDPTGIHGLRPA